MHCNLQRKQTTTEKGKQEKCDLGKIQGKTKTEKQQQQRGRVLNTVNKESGEEIEEKKKKEQLKETELS